MEKKAIRVISFLMMVAMLINVLPVLVFASAVEKEITVSASSTWGIPGDTVEVTVSLEDNPGIASMKLNIAYDSYLTLTDVKFDSVFGAYVSAPTPYSNPQTLNFINPTSETTANGNFATLTFKIAENAPDNYVADVTVAYEADDTVDNDLNKVNVNAIDGNVRIYHRLAGDVDGNRSVNNKDAILLFQYVSGWGKDATWCENNNIDSEALNVNGDNSINNIDAITLFRYVAGWDVEIYRGEICTHELTFTAAKDATCTVNGNGAYWQCGKCESYFSDENAKNGIYLKDIVIAANGHTEVIDEAVAPTYDNTGLTEGSHCSVCNEVLKAQEVIEKLEANYHSITYQDYKGAVIPEEYWSYAEHKGIDALPDISVPGYNFLGWYTARAENSDLITSIPEGTKTYTLYAHWEKISYTITYIDAPDNDNVKTYTVEDEFVLLDPKWSGLAFSHWTNQNGDVVTKVKKGTTGNTTFTANWTYQENMAVQSKEEKLTHIVFDEELGRYYFIYKIGQIDNIVLKEVESQYKQQGETLTWTKSKTVTIGKEIADSVSKAVSTSFSQTNGWSETQEWVQSNSVSSTITSGLEVEGFGIKAKIEAAISASTETSQSKEYGISGSTTGGSEMSNSVSSTVSYSTNSSTTITTENTISGDMPAGIYRNVCVGKLHVYAVVTYDPDEQNYYFDTFSMLDEKIYGMRLYEPSSDSTVNVSASKALDVKIPTEEIVKLVNASYYVKYDANGGTGEMPISAHAIEEETALHPCNFRKGGYTFDCWVYSTPSGDMEIAPGETVCNLGNLGETITVYAKWTLASSKITYVSSNEKTVNNEKMGGSFRTIGNIDTVTHNVSTLNYALSVTYEEYYNFVGWFTKPSGGIQITDYQGRILANATGYTNEDGKWIREDSEPITLYAQYKQVFTGYTYLFTADDFKWHIGNNLQKTSKPSNCGTGKYMLLNDINLGDWNEGWGYTYWASNNESTTLNGKTCFKGVFDGRGHTITYKLRIGKTSLQSWAFGLFPVTDGATIKYLHVNADLSTYDPQNRGQKWHISNGDRAEDAMVGGLIGYAKNTTVEACSVSGRVYYNSDGGGGDTCVAGVVGYAYNSTINNCSSSAEVYARGYYVNVAGVIACYYNTSYSGLSATGYIHLNEDWLAGGHWSGNEVTKSLKVL